MSKQKPNAKPGTFLEVERQEGERPGQAVARELNAPFARHGLAATQIQGAIVKGLPDGDRPGLVDYATDLKERGGAAAGGDLTLASHILASQAVTLDAIFTEMARRSGINMGEYLEASERYMRLALKAQANSRATLEALARLHQPREQTVRHVHVNEAGRPLLPIAFTTTTGAAKMQKPADNPMQPEPERLASAPRCLARTRSGTECQSPAVKGRKRCRMHGGTNPGAPKGNRNARKHGGRSAKAEAAARYLREIARLLREVDC